MGITLCLCGVDDYSLTEFSIFHNHEVEGIQTEAGLSEGFFEGGLVGLEVFDFGWVDGGVEAGEVLQAGNFGLKSVGIRYGLSVKCVENSLRFHT